MNVLILNILSFLIGIILFKLLYNRECFINISNDLRLITEKLCNDIPQPITKSYIIGGWCQCAYGNRPTWSKENGANTIIAGGFQTNGAFGPCQDIDLCTHDDINALSDYSNKWLSVGGQDVANGQSVSACLNNAIELINTFNMNGIAFDMEGCLDQNIASKFDDISNWIIENKGELLLLNPDFKFILVPLLSEPPPLNYIAYNLSIFDFIAPMMYGQGNSYQHGGSGWTIDIINNRLSQQFNNIDNEKILITFQSESANFDTVGQNMLRQLSNLVNTGNYAGILGWGTTDDNITDNNNLNIIKKILH